MSQLKDNTYGIKQSFWIYYIIYKIQMENSIVHFLF